MPVVDIATLPGQGLARDREVCRVLEKGNILLFPSTPFALPDKDREILLRQRQTEAGYHKNLAYRPSGDRVTGVARPQAEDARELRCVRREYSKTVVDFAAAVLPPYAGQWHLDYDRLMAETAERLAPSRPVRLTTHNSQLTTLLSTAGIVLLPLLFSSALTAQSPFAGPRSAGMAGAAVAVSDDGSALWTNPAGFARDPRLDIEILAGGVATNRNEFTSIVDRLSAIDFSRLDQNVIAAGIADLKTLSAPGAGVVASGVAGLVVGKGGWALGIGDLAYAGVYPTVDLVRVLPGSDPATGFVNNASALSFAGLEAREARFAYATSFFAKTLLVGATARYIQGRTYFLRQSVFDTSTTDPAGLARKAFKENERQTDRLTFDVGAMVNILGKVRVGLVSTAITEPEFDVARDPANPSLIGAPATLRLPRTLRAGIAAEPVGLLTVAADYDLRETNTLVPGGKSRQFSVGAELKLPLFAIRAGTFRDSAAPDPHWAYSAGIGLGLQKLSVNAAVVFSSEGGLSLSSTNRRDVGASLDARLRF